MKPYPPIGGISSFSDVTRFFSTISHLRQEDIGADRALDGRFLKGRLRTDRTVPTSITPDTPDKVFDMLYDGERLYILVNTGTAFEWRSASLSNQFLKTGGTLNVNTTEVSNVGTGEDDLITYSVPASTLATDGDSLEITAWGTFAANGNNKTIKIKFGATTILDTTAVAANGGSWVIRAGVIRTGAATQQCYASLVTDNTSLPDIAKYTTAAETLSGAVTLKCTGEATSNADITQKGLKVILNEV